VGAELNMSGSSTATAARPAATLLMVLQEDGLTAGQNVLASAKVYIA